MKRQNMSFKPFATRSRAALAREPDTMHAYDSARVPRGTRGARRRYSGPLLNQVSEDIRQQLTRPRRE